MIDSFLTDEEAASLYGENDCLMTRDDNGNLIIYRNKDMIKEIKDYSTVLRMLICRRYQITDGNFSYDILIPSPTETVEEVSSTSTLSLRRTK